MLWGILIPSRKQESASLITSKMTATAVIPESGLVQEELMMTTTRVEPKQLINQIMESNTSKLWVIFWCSDMKGMKKLSQCYISILRECFVELIKSGDGKKVICFTSSITCNNYHDHFRCIHRGIDNVTPPLMSRIKRNYCLVSTS